MKKKKLESTGSSREKEDAMGEMAGGQQQQQQQEDAAENYLIKQLRRKVSQMSAATSYQSRDVRRTADAEFPLEERTVSSTGVQKFRRDSDVKRFEPAKRRFKRGTLESHSFTDVRQPTLKDFFFGSKEGSMHQGSDNFPEAVRNNQGLCMPVAAYCFSMLKHPTRWTTENIDEILEAGNVLMVESKKRAHMHCATKELNHQQLQKYCVIGDKKVRFTVEEPEVFGFVRSDDRRVFNLTKGLRVFFARQSAGILKTQEANIGMWRDRHYYMFDARPRTRDMYYSPYGTAVMANFYDVAALATVLLTRSKFGNWPFAIYPVRAIGVSGRDELEAEPQAEPDVCSNFNIINERKAVVSASFDLADKCFDFSRNKQSLAMATVALVYSLITPPNAWHRTTLDKIMIIGNRLYLECMDCESISELRVDCLPAFFTIGPYMVEIYIYANVYADLLYKKCCCMLAIYFEAFFEKSSNAIVQVDKCHLAVWKQRNMYYCFDPYSRDGEGFRCRDGTACLSMHTTIASLVETLAKNFDNKDSVFFVHALKVCKVHRDPVQSVRFPRRAAMDDFPPEELKRYRMRKSKKAATEKPVTVDYSALAMRKMLAGEEPERSVFEVGSNVDSLGVEQMPPVVRKHPSRSVLKRARTSRSRDVIADLDSPSLSDTQIEPPLPQQPNLAEEVEFMDLDSFQLTQEEMDRPNVETGHGDGEGEVGVGGLEDYVARGLDDYATDRLEDYAADGLEGYVADRLEDYAAGRLEEHVARGLEDYVARGLEPYDGGDALEGYGGDALGGYGAAGDHEGVRAEEGGGGEDSAVEDEFVTLVMTQTQVSQEWSVERSRTSQHINTDITFFPIQKEILYPTRVRDRQQRKSRAVPKRTRDDGWEDYVMAEPLATQSEELRKETNFKELPDGTQIVNGTKNVAGMGKDVEYMAPFVCIMAGVVAKKYGIATWTGDVVDYVLMCGSELYGASKLRYDQVSKLEIPKVTLGNTHFAVLVEYVFDTYTKQNILELAIEKILFVRSDKGVLVTPTYACALLYKNHLYYLYDPFGNNEVGLGEGPANEGTACFVRFKDVRSLVERIMHNKSKREQEEEVVYSRFVLSSVRVKTLHPSLEETVKKRKTKRRKEVAEKKTVEETEGEEGEGEEAPEGGKEMKRSAKRKGDDQAKDKDKDESEAEEEEEMEITEDGKRRITRRKAVNKVGYQNKDGLYIIEGTKQLTDRDAPSDELKEDHFVCLCACLMLLVTPIQKWDTKRVDRVLENGRHVFSHAEDLEISEKRTIKNVLIDRYFFDIVVRQLKVGRNGKSMSATLETILKRKISYFLVQLPNACYVVHKSRDGMLHLFDPYGFPGQRKGANKAGWVRFKNSRQARQALKRLTRGGRATFTCYNFEVTFIKKAPKRVYLSERLSEYDVVLAGRRERFNKPYYEDLEWIKTDAVAWSRRYSKAANGRERGKADNMWHNWDVEYAKDLFSLPGNIHQSSERFSHETRGRQTLANLVAAIGMTEIYDLSEWNSAVVDSILVNGDNYYGECRKNFNDADYEMCMDDLKEDCSIFPFSFKVATAPVVEGTMFLVRLTQFNLYKALRYFFDKYERRCGVVFAAAGERRRAVAFGKLRQMEYFMFDCEAWGPPMFRERTGSAYALRTTTLNRLLYVLTVTLRGGDFFIFEVEVNDLNPIS